MASWASGAEGLSCGALVWTVLKPQAWDVEPEAHTF